MSYDKLSDALALYEEQWLASLPSEEELRRLYIFSPRFERRMARLFSQQDKPYYPYINRAWKKSLLAAVLALLLFAASMSVSAIREPFMKLVVEVYERFSAIVFHSELNAGEKEIYRPSYLPDGLELINEEAFGELTVMRYTNADGASLTFRQYTWDSFELQIDTEHMDIEYVSIQGHSGIFYQNKGWNNFVWSSEKFSFWIMSDLDKAESLKVANSIDNVEHQ